MNNKPFSRCRNCKNCANPKSKLPIYCLEFGHILDEDEVVLCNSYKPIHPTLRQTISDNITKDELPKNLGLKETELETYKILFKAKGAIVVTSLPSKYIGALGRLKSKGYVTIYDNAWVKACSRVGTLQKRVKMVILNKYMGNVGG